MSDIKRWSNSAGGNTSASPNGFPEGMAPSGVNDAARETMASVRRWFESSEWTDLGHTPTYISAASFLVSAGQAATATYHIGRRIQALDGANTIYGTIHSSTWTASAVYIYTTNDAGANFTASLSGIAVGAMSRVNSSWPDQTATAAQVANQAYDAVAGAARNFGTTASANTVPIAGPGGQLAASWIPSGLTGGVWGITSTASTSISFSGSTSSAKREIISLVLPSAGLWELEYQLSGRVTLLVQNPQPTVTLSSVEGSVVFQAPVSPPNINITASFTNSFPNRFFTYSASITQTLVMSLYTTSTKVPGGFAASIRYRN